MTKHEYTFTATKVQEVSGFLQNHMLKNNLDSLTADECADILNAIKILIYSDHPKTGFRFREMLRQGRDRQIPLVTGAYQERPRTRWIINKVAK